VNALWIVLFFAVMAVMWWIAYRIEPHYSSKDGTRFLCNSQEIVEGRPNGRARETRVVVLNDGTLHCRQRHGTRRHGSMWSLIGKSPTPPQRLQVYVAQELDSDHAPPAQLLLRLPQKSRVVAVLDRILTDRDVRRVQPTPGTTPPADPPDQD
jgi:hypothetical protein